MTDVRAKPLLGQMTGVIDLIQRQPKAAFAGFLALHFALWTALPTLLYANLPLDLIEALTYGREWPLGSDKLPPLPWWLVEIMYRLFGTDAAYYALAEAVVVVAFVLVWATARPLIGATGALVAVLIIDGMHFFQYTAVKFNHDVIQLPFWALAGYSFHNALKRGGIGFWLLLGVAFGGALWAKYFMVVLAFPYALFLLFDRDARRHLATPGPWLGLALALLITSPHLVWLINNNFVPFAYVDARSAPARGWFDHLWHPAFFAVAQVVAMLPSLLIAAMYVSRGLPGRGPRDTGGMSPNGVRPASIGFADRLPSTDAFDRRIVTLITFGPAITMVGLIAISGRGAITLWGYPLGLFAGLWIVLFLPRILNADRLTRIVGAWAAVFMALMLAFIANYTVLPLLDHRYRAEFFPGRALARDLTERFHAATGAPLRYVIGIMWDGGNVAHYSPDHPEVLIDGEPRRSPWIDLGKLRADGAVVVWTESDPTILPEKFAAIAPNATPELPFTLPARRGEPGEVHVGWAIVRPQGH